MNKMILGFATLLAVACVACGAEPSSESETESESAADEALSTVDVDNTAPTAVCKFAYTCNRTRFYSTLSACQTACGTARCYRWELYTGNCMLR